MKLIVRGIKAGVINLITVTLFFFFFNNLASIVAWSYIISHLKEYYFENEDYFYDVFQYRIYTYLIATAIFFCILSILWQLSIKCSSSAIRTIISLVIGVFLIYLLNEYYWEYLQTICVNNKSPIVFMAFDFDTQTRMLYFIIIAGLFFVDVIRIKGDLFIPNNKTVAKVCWNQINRNDNLLEEFTIYGIPIFICANGTWFLVYNINLPIKGLLVFVSCALICYQLIFKIKDYNHLNKYYFKTKNYKKEVLVCTHQYKGKDFLYYKIIKNKEYALMLLDQKIRIVPSELLNSNSEDPFVRADLIDDNSIMINSIIEAESIQSMRKKPTKKAYLSWDSDDIIEFPDCYFDDQEKMDIMINTVIRHVHYLSFNYQKKQLLNMLDVRQQMDTNVIIDEIVAFKKQIEKISDDFQLFDTLIKWLEIINYFYALVLVSRNNITVTHDIANGLEYADYGKWIDFRKKCYKKDPEFKKALLNPIDNDKYIFSCFESIYQKVVNREYGFIKYNIENLLDASKILRDYTRGHGVFIFTIDYEQNLKILKIIVYLLNFLITNNLLRINNEVLENNGWIVYYSDNNPFFLYSTDSKFKEYVYNSFREGSIISLPVDDWSKK